MKPDTTLVSLSMRELDRPELTETATGSRRHTTPRIFAIIPPTADMFHQSGVHLKYRSA